MRLLLITHQLTALIAVSYVTLGIADSDQARDLWAPYAVVMLILAAINLSECRGRR